MKVVNVKVHDIIQIENSRIVYNEPEMVDLMSSIKTVGLLQPPGVAKAANGKYELLFGNRRFAAVKKLGWDEVPCILLEKGLSSEDSEGLVMNLVENLQRKNVTSVEEGRIFNTLKNQFNLTESEIAVRCGITKRRVDDAIECFKHVPGIYRNKTVNAISGSKNGQLSAATARMIINIKKTHSLGTNANDLFKLAVQDNFSMDSLKMIGGLLGQGFDLKEAIKNITKMKIIQLKVAMPIANIQRLEKQYKSPITQILTERLINNKEFKISAKKEFRTSRRRLNLPAALKYNSKASKAMTQ